MPTKTKLIDCTPTWEATMNVYRQTYWNVNLRGSVAKQLKEKDRIFKLMEGEVMRMAVAIDSVQKKKK